MKSGEPKEKAVLSLGITQILTFTVVIFLAGIGVVGWANANYETSAAADQKALLIQREQEAQNEKIAEAAEAAKNYQKSLDSINGAVQKISNETAYIKGYLQKRQKSGNFDGND